MRVIPERVPRLVRPVVKTAPNDPRPSRHAHKLVYETAWAMAMELYETLMLDNAWFRVWKRKNVGATPSAMATRFCNANVGGLLPAARHTLAGMLGTSRDPELCERIECALIADRSLMRTQHDK